MKRSRLLLILTCKCDQAMEFLSDSFDHPLTASERWAFRLHRMVCRNCRRVTRQLHWLHDFFAQIPEEIRKRLYDQSCRLSPEAKLRIQQQLRDSTPNGGP